MTYLCKKCGNSETFNATQEETNYVTQVIYLDGEGEITDYGDSDTNDSETNGDIDNIECSECGSDDVIWIDDDDEFKEAQREILEGIEKKKRINNWKQRLK